MAAPIVLGPRHVVLVDQVLQLAVAVDLAFHALVRMIAEQHLQHEARVSMASWLLVSTTMPSKTGVVQAVCRPRPLHRDDAHAAGADIAQIGMVAERRDVDPVGARRLEDGAAFGAVTRWPLMVRLMDMDKPR